MANMILPDKYNMAQLVEDMKARHVPDMNQNALLASTFGFIGEAFTNQMNMDIVAMSEISNEAMATKAKFDRDMEEHFKALDTEIRQLKKVCVRLNESKVNMKQLKSVEKELRDSLQKRLDIYKN